LPRPESQFFSVWITGVVQKRQRPRDTGNARAVLVKSVPF
jgi:hypothetical protein